MKIAVPNTTFNGIPVATVALDGAKNAGILAAQIIGAQDLEIRAKIADFKEGLRLAVVNKAQKLENQGWENY